MTFMQPSFTSGEISKRLGGRVDLAKYGSALETCLNALPQPHGGITRRPGTQFIAQTSVQTAGELVRLIPFEYSTGQAYIIEMGHEYARFYMDGGQIQSFDSYTKLCIHPTGVNASTNITDAATSKTVTVAGNVKIDTATSPFSTGSCINFPGATGDYLSLADSADWFMNAAAFTFDAWIKIDVLPTAGTAKVIFQQYASANEYVTFYIYNLAGVYQLRILIQTGGGAAELDEAFAWVPVPVVDTWYHIALIRGWAGVVNSWAVTVNGAQIGATLTSAVAWHNVAAAFEIGNSPTVGYVFNGKMAEVRVSKGIARWTDNFAPPSVAYPLSSGSTVYEITTTPYTEDELAAIKYCQSADYLYLTHPDNPPATLTRSSHVLWNYATMAFAWPAFKDNLTATTLAPTDVAVGAVSVVASASLFTDNWVGDDIKFEAGYLNVASVQDATNCSGNVVVNLSTSTASAEWGRSSWNVDNGFPACVMFFEERLAFAATQAQPQTAWLSVSGDYQNFNEKVGATIADTDACTYTISSDQVNAIKWLAATTKLVVGTTGAEFLCSGNNDDGVTPSNVKIRESTSYGSADIMPVKIGNAVMFLQRAGKKIREFAYNFQNDAYAANELTVLAEHLTRNNTIVDMAFQKLPNQVLWCVRNDGALIALTYLKEHEVVGWSRHELGGDGAAESIAVIPGTDEDEVWLVVRRTINGSVVRYIERLKQFWNGTDIADAFYVDCGMTYAGANVTTVGGLSHLEGCAVAIHADGVTLTASTVSGGELVLGTSAAKVHVGLAMTTDIKTLRCGPVEVQGKIKRISKVVVRFFETCGNILLGSSATDADTKDLGDSLITDDALHVMPTGYDTDGQIFIRKSDTQPMTVLSIIPKLEVFDETDGV